MQTAKIGILTVSDRASAGIYDDISGKAIIDTLNQYLTSPWQAEYKVIPDEQPLIEQTLCQLVDELGCCLVVTTGGTGPKASFSGAAFGFTVGAGLAWVAECVKRDISYFQLR